MSLSGLGSLRPLLSPQESEGTFQVLTSLSVLGCLRRVPSQLQIRMFPPGLVILSLPGFHVTDTFQHSLSGWIIFQFRAQTNIRPRPALSYLSLPGVPRQRFDLFGLCQASKTRTTLPSLMALSALNFLWSATARKAFNPREVTTGAARAFLQIWAGRGDNAPRLMRSWNHTCGTIHALLSSR
jgi:hypothetical protein